MTQCRTLRLDAIEDRVDYLSVFYSDACVDAFLDFGSCYAWSYERTCDRPYAYASCSDEDQRYAALCF